MHSTAEENGNQRASKRPMTAETQGLTASSSATQAGDVKAWNCMGKRHRQPAFAGARCKQALARNTLAWELWMPKPDPSGYTTAENGKNSPVGGRNQPQPLWLAG